MFTGCKEGKSPRRAQSAWLREGILAPGLSKPPWSLDEQPTCGSGSFKKGLFWASCRHPGSLSMVSRHCIQRPLLWGRVWTLLQSRSASRDLSRPHPQSCCSDLLVLSSLSSCPPHQPPPQSWGSLHPGQCLSLTSPNFFLTCAHPTTWASRLEWRFFRDQSCCISACLTSNWSQCPLGSPQFGFPFPDCFYS